jgi:MSHA pilin protein MshD
MSINLLDRNSGFTLVELVISMTIISIGLLGTLLSINTATRFSGNSLITTQAIAIAESYLEEIVAKNFQSPTIPAAANPCPPTALTRASFTDICNYNGLHQAPTDQNGNAIEELSAYTVQVSVDSKLFELM